MTFRGGDYFTAEIGNRIAGRWTPAQILPYLNESLGIISSAGSFIWDQAEYLGQVTTANAQYLSLGGALDVGKKISCLNNGSKTPISKVPVEEYGLSAAGYVDQTVGFGQVEYNTFKLFYNTPSGGAALQFYPANLSALLVDIYYHMLPPVLTTSATPTVRWDIVFMDSILLDMTEAACKRILSWVGWQDREAASRSKLQEAVRIYSTDRINTGTAQETANAVQEKTQLGRA